jgi:excisionase family DNA binding protein
MQRSASNRVPDASPGGTVRLLTAKQLAAALQLNEQTVYRLARNGGIPFVRIGKKAIRFDLERVREAWATPAPSFKRSPWPFVRLDDLLGAGEWLKPPADVVLKRFKVRFPTKDLTRLAYDRTAR